MDKPVRCVLIEDEPLAIQRLEKLIQKSGVAFEIVARLESVNQALNWFRNHPMPDLVFSDIQLGDGISFSIFEEFPGICPLIFTTSYDEYAIRAFRHHSIDYLLKPIKPEDLNAAIRKYQSLSKQESSVDDFRDRLDSLFRQLAVPEQPKYRERFLVRQGDQLIPVEVGEVAFFMTRNDWVCLCTADSRQFMVDFRLDELEQILEPGRFFRLNRQFLVAHPALKRAHHHLNGKLKIDLDPKPEDEVFVSREKASSFRDWWENAGR